MPQEDKITPEAIERASAETERLQRELDITNADHIALWLEANMADSPLGWLACRIVEAHEAVRSADRAYRQLRKARDMTLSHQFDDLKDKITPGEWHFEQRQNESVVLHGHGDGYANRVACCIQWTPAARPRATPAEALANATFIALCATHKEAISTALRSQEERNDLFDALGMILGADPGPKAAAAYQHARELWHRLARQALDPKEQGNG